MPVCGLDEKKSQHSLIRYIESFLPKTKEDTTARIADNHFNRNRKLPLAITLALLINMVRPGKRFGYQEVINRFFSDTGLAHDQDTSPPDKSAFLRARRKLPAEVLSDLFEKAVDQATAMASSMGNTTWKGFRLLAIDGTKKNLPRSNELVDFYGTPSGAHYPQMLSCALFDVLAKIPLNMMWGSYLASERVMAKELIQDLGPGDLLLLDRGYPSFELFEIMLQLGVEFLVRLQDKGMFGSVSKFLKKGRRDGIVTIYPPEELVRQRQKEGQAIPEPIQLRVVKVSTKGKKSAVFITTLTDRKKYSLRSLRKLYHLRWEEEEFYKVVKELLEAENFRGKSCQFIDQEMLALYLYTLLVRILMMDSARVHDIPVANLCQQAAYLAVTRFIDKIWLAATPEECQRLLACCLLEITWQRYKKREGRSYPRKSKRSYGKWGRR